MAELEIIALRLPMEIVVNLLKRLQFRDLCNLAQSCTYFRRVCQLDDIWQYFCLRDYGIRSIDQWPVESFMELYKTVFVKYGHLIGDWKIKLHPFGGILSVKAQPGRIVGHLWNPPTRPYINEPFRKQELFEVKIQNKICVCNCLSANTVPHLAKLVHSGNLSDGTPSSSLRFVCLQHFNHPECRIDSPRYVQWCSVEFPDVPHSFSFDKYKAYDELYLNTQCERLQWPNPISTESLPKPGLFKGAYGCHGIEFIMVHISSGQIIGTKITGDANIPATKVTFKANVNRVVSLHEIEDLDLEFDEEENQNEYSVTTFQLPHDFESEYENYPTNVKARYHGVGQVADVGYVNPEWTPAHFILFDENLFGVLWPELQSLFVYSRVDC